MHFSGFERPLNEYLIVKFSFLFAQLLTNKWKEEFLSLEKRRRREMAFWHEGCGAALYANFSLSAFPLCGEEKWPPENKNGGKRISLYDVDALLFPPSMLFCFSTLVQNISRKRRRYILSRRTLFFFFPALPTSSSFLCHGTRGGGGRRDRRFFFKRNIYLIFLFPFKKTNCIHKFLF